MTSRDKHRRWIGVRSLVPLVALIPPVAVALAGGYMLVDARAEAEALAPIEQHVLADVADGDPGLVVGHVLSGGAAPAVELVQVGHTKSGPGRGPTDCVLADVDSIEIDLRDGGGKLTVELGPPPTFIDDDGLASTPRWQLLRLGDLGPLHPADDAVLARCPAARGERGPWYRTQTLPADSVLTVVGCRDGHRLAACAGGGNAIVAGAAGEALRVWVAQNDFQRYLGFVFFLIGGVFAGAVAASGQLHNTGRGQA